MPSMEGEVLSLGPLPQRNQVTNRGSKHWDFSSQRGLFAGGFGNGGLLFAHELGQL